MRRIIAAASLPVLLVGPGFPLSRRLFGAGVDTKRGLWAKSGGYCSHTARIARAVPPAECRVFALSLFSLVRLSNSSSLRASGERASTPHPIRQFPRMLYLLHHVCKRKASDNGLVLGCVRAGCVCFLSGNCFHLLFVECFKLQASSFKSQVIEAVYRSPSYFRVSYKVS